jgi:hypothetical protein
LIIISKRLFPYFEPFFGQKLTLSICGSGCQICKLAALKPPNRGGGIVMVMKKPNQAELENRIQQAMELAKTSMSVDGDHHTRYYLDQMVRVLAGDDYHRIVGETIEEVGRWEEGIAP